MRKLVAWAILGVTVGFMCGGIGYQIYHNWAETLKIAGVILSILGIGALIGWALTTITEK